MYKIQIFLLKKRKSNLLLICFTILLKYIKLHEDQSFKKIRILKIIMASSFKFLENILNLRILKNLLINDLILNIFFLIFY